MSSGSYLIGVAGASASGKTSISHKIQEAIENGECTLISTDCFYKELTQDQHNEAQNYNWDHPDAFDFEEMHHCLSKLLMGEEVNIPVYDYVNNRRSDTPSAAKPTRVIILEGIMALHDEKIRNMMNLKIFVHTDSDECLARRILRDTQFRGRDVLSVINQYRRFVKPAFDDFIGPAMKHADIIVPRGGKNKIALNLITQNLKLMVQS